MLNMNSRVKINRYMSGWDTTHQVYAVLYYGCTGQIKQVNEHSYECVMDDYPDYVFLVNKDWVDAE